MSIDIIVMLASTVMGFVFKMWANGQEDKANQYNRMIGQMKQEEVMLNSARSFSGGALVRRFIVIVAMFIFASVTVGSGFDQGVTSMIATIERPSYFFGMFGGGTEVVINEINGMVYSKDITHVVLSIIGFYFGSSSANRK